MGGMTALGYLGLAADRRPIELAGLVLPATAAGKLRQRGMGRLLGTPATTALFGVVDRAPEQAVSTDRSAVRNPWPVAARRSTWR